MLTLFGTTAADAGVCARGGFFNLDLRRLSDAIRSVKVLARQLPECGCAAQVEASDAEFEVLLCSGRIHHRR